MMLNQMPAGRPEPQWTKSQSGSFKDCEWRVEEMEFLGVKDRYVMIRGTNPNSYDAYFSIPGGLRIYPSERSGFVLQYWETGNSFEFIDANLLDIESDTAIYIPRNPLSNFGDCRFFVIAKTIKNVG